MFLGAYDSRTALDVASSPAPWPRDLFNFLLLRIFDVMMFAMLLLTLATAALAGQQLTLQSPSQATHAINGKEPQMNDCQRVDVAQDQVASSTTQH